MRIAIRHQLTVSPQPGTNHLVMQLLLTPLSGPTQTIIDWTLDAPGIDHAARFVDAYGNKAHLLNRTRPPEPIVVTVTGEVDTQDKHGVLGKPGGEPVPALYKRVTPLTKVPVTLYSKFRGSKDSQLDLLHGLMLRVSEALSGLAPDGQSQEQTGQRQSQGQGRQSQSQGGAKTEQDSPSSVSADATLLPEAEDNVVPRLPRPPATDYAHMFVGAARALNIPARYVTGYLVGETDEPAAFHAWAEAFDDRLGWIGFDPMLELCPTDRHVRLAMGLDAISAAPLRCVPAGESRPEESLVIRRV
jgi:transglutaminase-like putative cysteine protease